LVFVENFRLLLAQYILCKLIITSSTEKATGGGVSWDGRSWGDIMLGVHRDVTKTGNGEWELENENGKREWEIEKC